MKTALGVMLVLVIAVAPVNARETDRSAVRPLRAVSEGEPDGNEIFAIDRGIRDRFIATQVDTYCIVWYDFEQMDWQGWTRVDANAQEDTFFHVDDFAGLGGGDYGLLYPIEGTRSMWCGTRPGDDGYLCSWVDAPGYGNNWEQYLETEAFAFTGLLTISYHGVFDSEPEYDYTYIEYDTGGGNWIAVTGYDGTVDTVAVHELLLAQFSTKLRFHFTSDGAWSDQDGNWSSDGAAIVDEITITDVGGTIDYEDFEDWSVDAKTKAGALWKAVPREGYGLYSGLKSSILVDKDPCGDNIGTQIVFFIGSPYPSADYPGLFDTPFCTGPGGTEWPCQDEQVVSPVIDMTRYSTGCDHVQDADIPPAKIDDLGGCYFRFTVYRDLPVPSLVFYYWGLRNIDPTGCPGPWLDRAWVYYGPDKDYIFTAYPVGDLVGNDPIQIMLGCVDMCDAWFEVYGNCANHTPSPWFDNVRIQRYDMSGPQWSYRDLDLFQDNFPEEEFDIESHVRADCANDLRPNNDPVIDPGDSIVVTCNSPLAGGIDTTPDGWPMVYLHCYVHYIGDPLSPKPDLFGPSLEGTYGRYDSDDGQWTILQCDYARTGAGNIAADKYMVDMNDSLLTRGYAIYYYFKAYDFNGDASTLPNRAGDVPWPPYPGIWHIILHWLVSPYFFEWTCLPTLASDVLFVDDFHGRGTIAGNVEQYWMPCFKAALADGKPDVYDVNNPSSAVSNGLGSRAKNYHMTTAYQKVIWDSGNLESATISEGTEYSDKSNDAQCLVDWMEFSPHRVGLWVCGDDIAMELAGAPSGVALTLLTAYCGVQYVGDSYYLLSGIVTPKVMANSNLGNPLYHSTWGDSFYVFGGCPIINAFDYLEKTGNGEYALDYPDVGGLPYYAGIYSVGFNNGGYPIRTMWFGFSFMYVRDVDRVVPIMRNKVVYDVIAWMENDVQDYMIGPQPPSVNSLSQNYPNPFNPTTTIKFALRSKSTVSIKIYDVAGRLVKTLVNEVRDAGRYEVTWDGTNNHDATVASGVYFYKMNTKEFEQTKKMVLLR